MKFLLCYSVLLRRCQRLLWYFMLLFYESHCLTIWAYLLRKDNRISCYRSCLVHPIVKMIWGEFFHESGRWNWLLRWKIFIIRDIWIVIVPKLTVLRMNLRLKLVLKLVVLFMVLRLKIVLKLIFTNIPSINRLMIIPINMAQIWCRMFMKNPWSLSLIMSSWTLLYCTRTLRELTYFYVFMIIMICTM